MVGMVVVALIFLYGKRTGNRTGESRGSADEHEYQYACHE